MQPLLEVVRGLDLMVALQQGAQRLRAGLRIGVRECLQGREGQLGLGDREPPVAHQPSAKPGGRRGESVGCARGEDEDDAKRISKQNWLGELMGSSEHQIRVAGLHRSVEPRDR